MTPRKALKTAVEAVASSSTLRRSSRRSASSASTTVQQSPKENPIPNATTSSVRQLPPSTKRQKVDSESDAPSPQVAPSSQARRRVKAEPPAPPIKQEPETDEVKPAPAIKRRRTKKEVDEAEIFPPRPPPVSAAVSGGAGAPRGLYIGAHISSAGGVENAPLNALRIGANAFSCFVRPKMQWASTPIADTSAELFKQRVLDHSFMPAPAKSSALGSAPPDGFVVPHGCYLVNLANPDEAKRDKSFEAFMDDLRRCELLGIRLFNFHPGSMTAASVADAPVEERVNGVRPAKAEACATVASYINRAHALTRSVTILVENMAGSKNDTLLGSSLSDLACILSHVKDRSRVGVCIDTCHAFAAGYDLTTPQAYADFAAEIDRTLGWKCVKAMHLNDSKFGLGCRRDRHENIGRGCIGIGGFWNIVNDPRCADIPLILETPALGAASAAYAAKEATVKMHQVWSFQIQALHALRGTEWGKWKEAEEWLAKADQVIIQAAAAHAVKKRSSNQPTKARKKAHDAEESELSEEE
ncbi:hypothetical protein PaG_01851 [Moesziomyces aphidis]|uniref:Apurinic-apyrimidinic endonuclease 1 n=1 Tax=Moesziomyces aphidis TaxID=84754 RepID=W3VPR5_MOEAP|nr:hypothetical protein PaG_01851 [Moesziomyces aphidis]